MKTDNTGVATSFARADHVHSVWTSDGLINMFGSDQASKAYRKLHEEDGQCAEEEKDLFRLLYQ